MDYPSVKQNFSKFRNTRIILILLLVVFNFYPENAKAAFPVITDVASSEVTTISATITWTTNINSNSLVDYGATTSYGYTLGDTNASVTSHTVSLTGLSPNTPYKFRVRSADGNGDQTTSDNGGAGFSFTTSQAPTIGNVRLAEVTNSSATITWTTDINAYPYLAYGNTSSYGQLIGDEETLGTSHSLTIAGISVNTLKHYKPRVKDIYGNFTYYGSDSVFTTGAPYLISLTTTTPNGTYGAGDEINITATYADSSNNDLDTVTPANHTITVYLDVGVQVPVTLVNVDVGTDTITGTYTVGETGSGESTAYLEAKLITDQNVCDINGYCQTGSTLPSINLNSNGHTIAIDTVRPEFHITSPPSDGSFINSVTASSDLSYDINSYLFSPNENLFSGSTTFARTGGTADPSAPHTCTLVGTALQHGLHSNFDTSNTTNSCVEGDPGLVNGAVYDITFNGEDPSGNAALPVTRSNVTYDTSAPVLQSFTSTTLDDTYGPGDPINITATYNENLYSGSAITVTLDTGAQVILNNVSTNTLSGTYTVGVSGSNQNTNDLEVSSIDSQNAIDQTGDNAQTGTSLPATNISDGSAIIVDTTAFTVQYYSDSGLTNSLGTNPRLMPGTYYLKITSNEALSGTPTINIDAEGSNNDVTAGAATSVGGNNYRYTRTVVDDGSATGTTLENISITGTDTVGNITTNADPTNESSAAGYTDTTKPALSSGTASPDPAKAGTVNISLTFNEAMDQSTSPTVVITKSDSNNINATGSFSNSTSWSGTATVGESDANGLATLKVSSAKDSAGNTMDANNNVDTLVIDTVNPAFTINDGTSASVVQNDTINITVSDSGGSGAVSQFYGFSINSTCDGSDTINSPFTSGVNFNINGNHTDYLCVKATDNAGNIGYQTVGQLNVDNTVPIISSVNSNHADGSWKAGEIIDIDVNFSEAVTTTGNVRVTLETGTADRSCTFSVSNSAQGSCNYTVQAGDTTSDLDVQSIQMVSGSIQDQAGNTLTNFTPTTSLALNKAIIIDTTAPSVNIVSPIGGNSVNGDSIIFFTDNESTSAQCSIDNASWVSCTTGSTTLSMLTGWSGLVNGSFTLYLKDTDLAGNTGTDSEANIIKDTNLPTITSITSNHADGSFKEGEVIDIDVNFSRNVTSDGDVLVTLDTGDIDRTCSFSVSGSTSGTCDYTVQAGDTSSDLNVSSISGEIYDEVNNQMINFTPTFNLADSRAIIIDTTDPIVDSVTSDHSNGTFTNGEVIDIDVHFSESVTSTSYMTVTLDTGGSCTFLVDNSNFGTCDYTVAIGQNSPDLNVANIAGTVNDRAGNAMTDFSPTSNLATSKNIVIDTTSPGLPTITSITSDHADGSFKEGEVIDIDVNFSEAVNSVGSVTVNLETGATDRSCTFSMASATSGSCNYTVQAGDTTGDLDVNSVTGSIKDLAGNDMTEDGFIPTTNLADNKAIVIDTTAPNAPSITLLDPITEANKGAVSITGTGEASAALSYSINDSDAVTSPITGSAAVGGDGAINITGIDISTLGGGTITASVTLTDTAGNESAPGTDTATSQIEKPTIASITSDHADGSFKEGEVIDIDVNFSEAVNSVGSVTVNLETGATDRSCTFSISSNTSGTCDYTVQAGDTSSNLDVSSISGEIRDENDNLMTNFIPTTNLADNKAIVIDTTAPNAPSITLLDPITEANKGAVSITGTGEASAALSYSINDSDAVTSPITGSAAVGGDGAINITGIDISTLGGGTITASVTLTDTAGNESAPGTDTATSQIEKPTIASITSDHADGSFKEGEVIDIDVNFSEIVSSTGDVTVTLETGTTDRTCTFSISSNTSGTCDYTVQAGDTSSNLDVSSISGEIRDENDNLMTNFIPTTNLADINNILIDTTLITLDSFNSSTSNDTYGPGSNINIKANYSENLKAGSTITVTLNTGASVTLSNITNNTTLSGTYTVGATGSGENTDDLTVSSIASQNACDGADNCQTGTTVPSANIADTSQLIVDTAAPIFSIASPSNSSNINNTTTDSDISFSLSEDMLSGTITITRTAWEEDPGSPHECILVGSALTTGAHNNFNTTNCQGGAITLVTGAMYTFSFQGTDLFGNTSDAETRTGISFGLDSAGPVISDITVTDITSSSATISWTTDEASSSLVDIGTTLSYGATHGDSDPSYTDHSVTIENLTPNTPYLFRVRSTDSDSNETIDDNSGQGNTFSTSALTTMTDAVVSDITSSSAKLTWTSEEDTYSYVNYGTTDSYGMILGNEESLTQDHTMTIAGLSAETVYYYRARTKDINGNYNLGSSGSFTTLSASSGDGGATADAPSVSGMKATIAQNSSVIIKWSTNKDCNGMVRYGLDKKYGKSAAEDTTIFDVANFTTSHVITINDLLSNATYHYSVVSYDSSGNIAISGDKTFNTPALSSISAVKITNINLNSATILWETGSPTTSEVAYGLSTNYGMKKTNTTLTNLHKIELTGLKEANTYHFRINGSSKDKNSVSSDDYIFATNAQPAINNEIVEKTTDSEATLTWKTNVETDAMIEYVNKDNPEDKGIQGLSDLGTDHKITLNGLSQGSQYEIKIKGTDINKNLAESKAFSITTDKDVQPPEITQVNTESSLINGKDDKVQSIILWKTNEPATSQVIFNTQRTSDDNSPTQESKEDKNLTTNHVVVLTNLKPGVVYYFHVASQDKNNNVSQSEAFSLLTPQKQKSVIQLIIANFEETFGWLKKMRK